MSQSVSISYSIDKGIDYSKIAKVITECSQMLSNAEREFAFNDDEIEFELNKIGETAVRNWYNSYSPRFYRRTEDLFNAYKVTIDYQEHIRNFEMGSEFMEYAHHQENDLIYWISFVNGIHGGFPNQNYAGRVPVGIFSEFSSNSQPQSASPRDTIQSAAEQLLKKYDQQQERTLRAIQPKINELMGLI